MHIFFVDSYSLLFLQKHELLVCDKFPVRCTLCGKFGICRRNIQQHIDEEVGDCPQAMVTCSFRSYGCQFKVNYDCLYIKELTLCFLHAG